MKLQFQIKLVTVFRQYIEDLLKTQGIRKALDFLEAIQIYVLHKGALTLEKPPLEEVSKE